MSDSFNSNKTGHLAKNRVYESFNFFGGSIRANIVPHCSMIASRTGRLDFVPIFLHVL